MAHNLGSDDYFQILDAIRNAYKKVKVSNSTTYMGCVASLIEQTHGFLRVQRLLTRILEMKNQEWSYKRSVRSLLP